MSFEGGVRAYDGEAAGDCDREGRREGAGWLGCRGRRWHRGRGKLTITKLKDGLKDGLKAGKEGRMGG